MAKKRECDKIEKRSKMGKIEEKIVAGIRGYFLRAIIASLVLVIFAILLISNPEGMMKILVIAAGVGMLVDAGLHIYQYAKKGSETKAMGMDLVLAVLEIVAGVYFITHTEQIISIFYIVIGVILIVENIIKFQMAVNMKEYYGDYKLPVVVAALSIACGVFIVFNPFDFGVSFLQVAGVILLVAEIIGLGEIICSYVRVGRIVKRAKATKKVIEAEVVEDKK